MNIPCYDCEHIHNVSSGIVSCFAVDDDDIAFYDVKNIANMINKCPLGYRAKKLSDTNTKVWREYDKVQQY